MKRLFPITLMVMLILTLAIAGCGGGGNPGGGNPGDNPGDSTPPNAPVSPTVTAATGQLTITWPMVTGATIYQVWYGTTDDLSKAIQYGGDFSGIACLITGLNNGTPYYVWVKANNSAGTISVSPSGSGTPTLPAPVKSDAFFVYGGSGSDSIILRMNDSGSNDTVVNSSAGVLLALFSTSLDRTKMAYLYSDSDSYIKFKDSSGTKDITPSDFNFSGEFSMALSPDGSKLAYAGDNYTNTHIWVISTTTGAALKLTNCADGQDKYPTWSPDGTQIAFVHFDGAKNAKIYKVNADGSSTDPYGNELFNWDTTSTSNESLMSLAWSPTNPYQMACSSRISSSNPRFCIYTLNLTTKERNKLTNNSTQHEQYPHWSKDGNYIFYEINKNIYYNSINNSSSSGSQITTDGKSSFYGWTPS